MTKYPKTNIIDRVYDTEGNEIISMVFTGTVYARANGTFYVQVEGKRQDVTKLPAPYKSGPWVCDYERVTVSQTNPLTDPNGFPGAFKVPSKEEEEKMIAGFQKFLDGLDGPFGSLFGRLAQRD